MHLSALLTIASCLAWQQDGIWTRITENLRGTLTLGTYHHFDEAVQEEEDTRYEARLQLEFSGYFNDAASYFITPRVYADNLGWASGVVDEEPETREDRFILDLEEAYLRFSSDRIDFSIGRQIYRWGVADAVNPVDNINPLDLIDVPTLEKMGVFSAALRYASEAFSMTLVGIPWFTPARLPGSNSRWQGDFGEAPSQFQGLNLTPGPRELPSNTYENAAYAFRLSSSSLLTGWDLAMTFYDGVDSIGVLRGDFNGAAVVLAQVFPRYRESGLSFSTTWRNMEMHGEAGFHDTDDNRMDDDYLEYVLGINLTFYSVPLTEETFIVLEYADERITHDKSPTSFFSGSGEYVRPLKGTWMTSIEFKINQETSLNLAALRNQGSHDGLWRAHFSRKFNDHLKLECGLDFVDGASASFFGRWRHNDRAFAMLTIFI